MQTETLEMITALFQIHNGIILSPSALAMIAVQLERYPEHLVLAAIDRCDRECGRITPPDIVSRIPGGHPSADEAWSIIAPALNDESITVVMTGPMQEAMGAAFRLRGDKYNSSKAFKDSYIQAVSRAQSNGDILPIWKASLGHDPSCREDAIRQAVESGRIGIDRAIALLPDGFRTPPRIGNTNQITKGEK